MNKIKNRKNPKPQNVVLSPNEIVHLRMLKVLSPDAYFFLALQSSYGLQKEIEVDRVWFCDYWNFTQPEFDLYVAKLSKKEAIATDVNPIMQLELFPDLEDNSLKGKLMSKKSEPNQDSKVIFMGALGS